VNVLLIAIGIFLAGPTAAFAIARSRDDKIDLGTVSTQWLIEYRQSQE